MYYSPDSGLKSFMGSKWSYFKTPADKGGHSLIWISKISDVNTDDRKKNSATSEDNSSHRATSYVDVRNVWFSNEARGKKM